MERRLRVHADAAAARADSGAVPTLSGAVVMVSVPDSATPQRDDCQRAQQDSHERERTGDIVGAAPPLAGVTVGVMVGVGVNVAQTA